MSTFLQICFYLIIVLLLFVSCNNNDYQPVDKTAEKRL